MIVLFVTTLLFPKYISNQSKTAGQLWVEIPALLVKFGLFLQKVIFSFAYLIVPIYFKFNSKDGLL